MIQALLIVMLRQLCTSVPSSHNHTSQPIPCLRHHSNQFTKIQPNSPSFPHREPPNSTTAINPFQTSLQTYNRYIFLPHPPSPTSPSPPSPPPQPYALTNQPTLTNHHNTPHHTTPLPSSRLIAHASPSTRTNHLACGFQDARVWRRWDGMGWRVAMGLR